MLGDMKCPGKSWLRGQNEPPSPNAGRTAWTSAGRCCSSHCCSGGSFGIAQGCICAAAVAQGGPYGSAAGHPKPGSSGAARLPLRAGQGGRRNSPRWWGRGLESACATCPAMDTRRAGAELARASLQSLSQTDITSEMHPATPASLGLAP